MVSGSEGSAESPSDMSTSVNDDANPGEATDNRSNADDNRPGESLGLDSEQATNKVSNNGDLPATDSTAATNETARLLQQLLAVNMQIRDLLQFDHESRVTVPSIPARLSIHAVEQNSRFLKRSVEWNCTCSCPMDDQLFWETMTLVRPSATKLDLGRGLIHILFGLIDCYALDDIYTQGIFEPVLRTDFPAKRIQKGFHRTRGRDFHGMSLFIDPDHILCIDGRGSTVVRELGRPRDRTVTFTSTRKPVRIEHLRLFRGAINRVWPSVLPRLTCLYGKDLAGVDVDEDLRYAEWMMDSKSSVTIRRLDQYCYHQAGDIG